MNREKIMMKRPGFRAVLATLLLVGSAAWVEIRAESIPGEFLNDLKSEEFKVREHAELRLLEWSRMEPQVRVNQILDHAKNAPDPEVRQRSHNVLYALAMDDYLQEGEGFVGIQMVAMRAQVPGRGDEPREVIAITRVLRDTPAREAGLRVGDMIAQVNGENLAAQDALLSFQNMIRAIKPGTPTDFGIIRDGELIKVALILGRRPPEQQVRVFGQAIQDMNELAKRDQDRFFKEWLENLEN